MLRAWSDLPEARAKPSAMALAKVASRAILWGRFGAAATVEFIGSYGRLVMNKRDERGQCGGPYYA